MADYGEPWLWGFWVRDRDPADKKDYYTFCETLPSGQRESAELWANIQYGDRVHCSKFSKQTKHRPIIYDSGDYYQGVTYDEDLASRGVDCVNAMRGVSAEALNSGSIRRVVEDWLDSRQRFRTKQLQEALEQLP